MAVSDSLAMYPFRLACKLIWFIIRRARMQGEGFTRVCSSRTRSYGMYYIRLTETWFWFSTHASLTVRYCFTHRKKGLKIRVDVFGHFVEVHGITWCRYSYAGTLIHRFECILNLMETNRNRIALGPRWTHIRILSV